MSRLSKKAQAKSSKSGRAQVNVRTTPELLTRIDEARQDTSRSEFIVQAIEAYLGIEPASPETTATVQSLVDAAVAQALQGMTHTLEQRLKALESRLSGLGVDETIDGPVDEVIPEAVDERVDSGDAPVDEVAWVDVDQPVDVPVDSVDDAGDDAVEGEELATSGDSGLEETTVRYRNGSQESEVGVDPSFDSVDAPVDLVDDAGDDAVEGEELATSGDSGLAEATVRYRNRSQESEVGVDAPFDFTTQGLSGKELASRLSVSPSSITSNRQKKGTNAFAKWTSQQDPDGLAWNHKKGRYYPDEPKG
ncbi:ribbon-helix-helix domain-containing protein [Laspinema sp. D1]|uniref:ribbon-helix-helix domain-containing protein n=1 Tax=Laspinema palackyanum TaxID=3231601 RepID=UPI00346A4BC3|nr:ribbon-helix-helix domain-containing protein [Laspinema sp. D2b]